MTSMCPTPPILVLLSDFCMGARRWVRISPASAKLASQGGGSFPVLPMGQRAARASSPR